MEATNKEVLNAQSTDFAMMDGNEDLIPCSELTFTNEAFSKAGYGSNTTQTLVSNGSAVGLRVVIRNFEGIVVAAGVFPVRQNLSVLKAEALAILRVVELALDISIHPFMVERLR
ncbi:hypothetical protein ACOSQ2_007174 [Xanthoceras sorbifolium]